MGLFNKNQVVKIKVDHGYEPAVVKVKQGKPVQLAFKRTNPSTCLEKVKSTQLGFDQSLPMNQAVTTSTPAGWKCLKERWSLTNDLYQALFYFVGFSNSNVNSNDWNAL